MRLFTLSPRLSAAAAYLPSGAKLADIGCDHGRLPIYCSLYSMGILLPWEIRHIFSGDSEAAVRVTAVLAFLFFFYYQMHVAWGLF